MIVNCPACTTLYRYAAAPGVLAVQARCSGCETQFELHPTRRAYAIVADFPAAAGQVTGPAKALRGEAQPWNPPDGMNLGTFDYEPAAGAAPAAGRPLPQASKATVGEWLTALFLGCVGAGSGYYLAVLQEADVTTFVMGGSVIGLVLGWAVIRWMAREP